MNLKILEVNGLTKRFSGLIALDGVDFAVTKGEIAALIGPNGSGKTTLFNCISGFIQAEKGKIIYKGEEINGLPPHKIALLGISRSFQEAMVFPKLSLIDNLVLTVQQRQEEDLLGRFLKSKKIKMYETQARCRAHEILDFTELCEYKNLPANKLGYGQLKLFVFGMALMPNPDLLMLDEPSAATDPHMANKMKACLKKLKEEGKTILFVEHDMKVVMDVADHIIVLDHGKKISDGSPSEILNDDNVIAAYFGRDASEMGY